MYTLTEAQAIEIYRVLVKHDFADPCFQPQFIHDQVYGPTPLDWELKRPLGDGGDFWRTPGPAGTEEWRVTPLMDDERPKTRRRIDAVNLELAQLQNTLFP